MRQAMRKILAWRAVISCRKCREVSAVWVGCTEVPSFYFYLFIFIKQQWSCKCNLKYHVSFRHPAKWFGYLSIYLSIYLWLAFLVAQMGNNLPAKKEPRFNPWSGRSPEKGNGIYIHIYIHRHTHFF